MTDSPIEPLDLLDTDYADMLAKSSDPSFRTTTGQVWGGCRIRPHQNQFLHPGAPKT